MKEQICVVTGIIGGTTVKLLGGFDYSLGAMLTLMCVDIILGFICAAVFKTSKYGHGVSSEALVKGGLRKCAMLCIIIIGSIIDNLFEMDYVRNAVVFYFIATEGISILEHLVHMNVKVPGFVVRLLDAMEDRYGNADMEDDNNETD